MPGGEGIHAGTAYIDVRGSFSHFEQSLNTRLGARRFTRMGKAAGGAFAAGAAAAGIAKLGYDIGASFDDAYDKIRIGTGKTGKSLRGLQRDFKGVVKTVPADFDTVSTAIAGVNRRLDLTGKPLRHVTRQFVELSRITKTDVGENIASVSKAFQDFDVRPRQMGRQLDYLFRAAQRSGESVADLAKETKQFGSPLRRLGFDFRDTVAMFASFEKTGVNVQTMMPGLRMALRNFLQEGKDPRKELLRTIEGVRKGTISAADAMKLFGARAGADMVEAIKQGRFNFAQFERTLARGHDTILKAGTRTRDFSEQLQLLKNRAFVKLEPVVTKAFAGLNSFTNQMIHGRGAGGEFRDTVEKIGKAIFPTVKWLGLAALNVGKFVARSKPLRDIVRDAVALGAAVKVIRWGSAITGLRTFTEGANAVGGMRGKFGRFFTWLTGASRAAGTASGSALTGGMSRTLDAEATRLPRTFGQRWRAGFSSVGKGVLGLALTNGIIDGVTGQGHQLQHRLQNALSGFTFGLVPGFEDKVTRDQKKQVEGLAAQVAKLGQGGSAAAPQLGAVARNIRDIGRDAAWNQDHAAFADALFEVADAADKARTHVQRVSLRRLSDELTRPRFNTARGLFRTIDHELAGMGPKFRRAGVMQAIELAHGLEQKKRVPVGTTEDLIRSIMRRYPKLIPFLRRTGHDSVEALNKALGDRRTVRTVQRQLDAIHNVWGQFPKFAHTNAHNVRERWQAAMDFLERLMNHGPKNQRDTARHWYEALAGDAKRTAAATKNAWARALADTSDLILRFVQNEVPKLKPLESFAKPAPRLKPPSRLGGRLGGAVPDDLRLTPIPRFAVGGQVGAGYGGGDRRLILAEDGENIWSKEDVRAAGGHSAVKVLKRAVRQTQRMQRGGPVDRVNVAPIADARGLAKVPELFKKTRTDSRKHLLDLKGDSTKTFREIEDDGAKRWEKLRKNVGDEQTDMVRDSKRSGDKLSKNADRSFTDTADSGRKQMTRLRKVVADRNDDIVRDTSTSMRRVDRVVEARLSDVVGTGRSRGRQFSRGMSSTMHSTDSAVYSGLSYIASQTNESLKSFGAKPVTLSIAKPHARGGIPNPGGSPRDDHVLYSPQGQPVAALSGSEGIVNTPQMGVINRALGVAKQLGQSAWGSLGELWGSGMTHYAEGGPLKRFAKGGSTSHWTRLIAAANKVDHANFPYHWGGGHEQPAHFEPFDCSGAVSYATQQAGYKVPTTVSGSIGSWGFPRGRGTVTIYYNSGHTWMDIGGRGWGTSGTWRPGSGGAGWYSGKPPESYRNTFSQVHLPDLGHAGDFGGVEVKRPVVKGPDGKPRRIAQGALDKFRKGAIAYAQKKFDAMADLSGQGLADGAGNYSGPLNRVFPRNGGETLSSGDVQMLARRAGFPDTGLALRVVNAESGRRPGVVNSIGATGLYQILISAHPDSGGETRMRNPWLNSLYAHKLFSAAGNSFHPDWNASEAGWARRGGLLGKLPRFKGGGWLHRAQLIWRALKDGYFHDFHHGMPRVIPDGGDGGYVKVTPDSTIPRTVHIPSITPDGIMNGVGEDEIELIHEYAHSEQREQFMDESAAETFAFHAARNINPYSGFNHGRGARPVYSLRDWGDGSWYGRDQFKYGRAHRPEGQRRGGHSHGKHHKPKKASLKVPGFSGGKVRHQTGRLDTSFKGHKSRWNPFTNKYERMSDNRYRAIIRKWLRGHPHQATPTGPDQRYLYNPLKKKFQWMGPHFFKDVLGKWHKLHPLQAMPTGPGGLHHHDDPVTEMDFARAHERVDADVALAALTPGAADDVRAITRKIHIDRRALHSAIASGNDKAIAEWAGNLKSDLDTRTELRGGDTQANLLAALKELKASIDENTHTYRTAEGISQREAVRALSDMISGQLGGFGVAPRASVPGSGAVARY